MSPPSSSNSITLCRSRIISQQTKPFPPEHTTPTCHTVPPLPTEIIFKILTHLTDEILFLPFQKAMVDNFLPLVTVSKAFFKEIYRVLTTEMLGLYTSDDIDDILMTVRNAADLILARMERYARALGWNRGRARGSEFRRWHMPLSVRRVGKIEGKA